jgi:hypothetical protein
VNDASSDDAEVERCKAEAKAALRALVEILRTGAGLDEKREKLSEAYDKEIRCADCIGRRSVEAFDQNPRSARTVNMADTSLNFLAHLIKFFTVVRARQAELGFDAQAFAPSPASFSNMQRLVALYYKDRVEELKKSFHELNLPSNGFDKPFPMPPESTPSVPKWFPIAGVIFAALTLIFLMWLVYSEISGHPVPASGRFLVICVLAFGAAASGSFLGGQAAASGNIPLPGAQNHPIAFTAAGGVAILVIVLLVGYFAYVRPGPPTACTPSDRTQLFALIRQGHTVKRGNVEGCQNFLWDVQRFLDASGCREANDIGVKANQADANALGDAVNDTAALLEKIARQ